MYAGSMQIIGLTLGYCRKFMRVLEKIWQFSRYKAF
jgi:hypothetical protein